MLDEIKARTEIEVGTEIEVADKVVIFGRKYIAMDKVEEVLDERAEIVFKELVDSKAKEVNDLIGELHSKYKVVFDKLASEFDRECGHALATGFFVGVAVSTFYYYVII